jgi:hypothetical protein
MAANDRFDKEAAEWDNNPYTVTSSRFAFGALLDNVPQLRAAVDGSGDKGESHFLFLGFAFEKSFLKYVAVFSVMHDLGNIIVAMP